MSSRKVYIEKLWISGETCLYNISNRTDYFKAKRFITEKRNEFVNKLRSEGFNVVFDRSEIDEDTICLIMDDTSLCSEDKSIKEYKNAFDKKIAESAGLNFNYPVSKALEDYLENPFFPAVFKNELVNGGVDKFLVENSEQVEIIKKFYDKYKDDPKFRDSLECVIMQQYLETPSKYATYLRVLVGGNGDVMGASLKYSARSTSESNLSGLFEVIFLNPNSEYFINARPMFNYYSNGQNISFNQPRYSSEKASVLAEHGFDSTAPQLPYEVLDVCENIMRNCNREIGVLCGIDFMLNKFDNKWYYLENQAFPAIEEWAQSNDIKISASRNLNGYLKYLELELQVRYEALMLLANENNKTKVKQKQ